MESTFEILNKRFPPGQYALMEEVRDRAGFNASRSADFVIMGLWPSRGLHLTGIERKSFRGDWLSELKKPQKAENIFQYCDFFYLLTDGENVAKIEEIPEPWGWMAIEKGKLVTKKEAPRLTPKGITMDFLATLLKRASSKDGWIRREAVKEELSLSLQAGKDWNKQQLETAQKLLKEQREQIRVFEEVSGVEIHNFNRWNYEPKKVGEAVKLIASEGVESLEKRLAGLLPAVEDLLKTIKTHIELFESLKPKP